MMETDTTVAQNAERALELFEEHGNSIRATIAINMNDKSMIDDIVQELYISLVQNPVPERVKNVKGYLCKAVKNDVLDAASQTKSRRLRDYRYAQMHTDRLKSKTPDDLAIHAEDIRQILGVVQNKLLQYEINAVMQKYRYDRDTSEAAEVMNITKRSFSHYLCTGLRKVRKFFCENQSQRNP